MKIPDAVSTDTIFKLAEDFVQNKKNANNLAQMIEQLANKNDLDSKLTNCCILGLQTMFSHSLPLTKKSLSAADQEYRAWLLKKHDETLEVLLSIIKSPKNPYPVREQAMVTYMHLLKLESQHVNQPKTDDVFCLPKMKYLALLKTLVAPKKGTPVKAKATAKLLNRFSEFTALHDVALQTWATCVTLTKSDKKFPDETKMQNILHLLGKTAVPTVSMREKNPEDLLFPNKANNLPRKLFSKKLPDVIDSNWNHIKKWHHTENTMHETLLLLLDKIMDNLTEPKLLTDFFMNALHFGGALSLLSLQGIFNLIQRHNIEYPDIYTKLYSLFTPEILHSKYKPRLFYLADLFLTSTHLPEALVAAFAKRLGRLALTASATDVLIIIPFIGNLLLRHKGLQKMIHKPEGGFVDSDPYLENEMDPSSCKAIDSSLWELKSLQSHLVPSVAIAARFINEKLPSVEWDLADVLEIKYSQVFEKEVNKKAKEITLNFVPPTQAVLEKYSRTF